MSNHKNPSKLLADRREQSNEMFLNFLAQFGPIPEEVRLFLMPHLRLRFFEKKTTFWPLGIPSNHIYFIVDGLVRGTYTLANGEEITNWIVDKGEIASIPASLFTGQPSQDALQALEDTLLIEIRYDLISKQLDIFPYLAKIQLGVMQGYILRYDQRCKLLRLAEAKQRLAEFEILYPQLSAKTPLYIVASYLGVSITTLNRLRHGMTFC